MVKNLTLQNQEIYNYAINLSQSLNLDELNLPIKVGFYLQKNISTLMGMGQEIETERNKIFTKYGTLSEDGTQYDFETEEKARAASKELNDLFVLEQEVKIYMIDLDSFGDIELTAAQIAALAFMIEGE